MSRRDGISERRNKRGDVSYQVRWVERQPDGSTRRHAKTFARRDQAEAFARSRSKPGTARAPAAMTVADLLDETLTRAADRLSERTILTYRQRAEKMIAPHLGDRRLIDLETIDVQRWIDKLGAIRDDAGQPLYKPATIHAAVAVLFGALRDAATLGLIDRNVAQGIRRPRIRRQAMTVWSAAEARTFLAHVADHPLYGAMWHVALATGMRPGELRALKWDAVDLDRGIVHVHRTMTKDAHGDEVIGEGTKRGAGRAVAISAGTVDVLRRHKRRQTERRLQLGTAWWDLGLVFDRGNGRWVLASKWRDAQVRACREAGVPFISAHSLRHTAATMMLEGGVHPKVVSDLLGHANIQMTLDVYSWVSSDLQRSATDALAAALFDEAAEG